MRLFIVCHNCNEKIYLTTAARTRDELPHAFNITCPNCNNMNTYYRTEVIAEPSGPSGTAAGAIIGGLIGLLGGPLGALLGATIGGGLGAAADNNDRTAVERFNRS